MSEKDALYHSKIREILLEHSAEFLTPKKIRKYLSPLIHVGLYDLENDKNHISSVINEECEKLNSMLNNPISRLKRQISRYNCKPLSTPYLLFENDYKTAQREENPYGDCKREDCEEAWRKLNDSEKNRYSSGIIKAISASKGDPYDDLKYIEHYLYHSGFSDFLNITREQFLTVYQVFNGKELYDVCTNRWSNFTQEQRAIFRDRFSTNIIDDYFQSIIPAYPRSPYQIFLKSERAECYKHYPANTFIDIGEMVFCKWKNMSSTEKAAYYEKCKQEETQFPLSFIHWKTEFPEIERRRSKLSQCLTNFIKYSVDKSIDECLYEWSHMNNGHKFKYATTDKELIEEAYIEHEQSEYLPNFIHFRQTSIIQDREIW